MHNLRDTIFYIKTTALQDFHICILVYLWKFSLNSKENTCVGASFLTNFTKKETPTQVLPFEFCEIFKKTLFLRKAFFYPYQTHRLVFTMRY